MTLLQIHLSKKRTSANPVPRAIPPHLPSRASAKAQPGPHVPCEHRTGPAERPIRQAERDRSEASLGGEQQNPSRTARKPNPSQSLLSERRTDPAERPACLQ
jgi:hypothetical protein